MVQDENIDEKYVYDLRNKIIYLENRMQDLENSLKFHYNRNQEWELMHHQQDEIIQGQAKELEEAKANYSREIASMDTMMTEAQEALKSAYATIEEQNTIIIAQRARLNSLINKLMELNPYAKL